jgi:hypothetical protein
LATVRANAQIVGGPYPFGWPQAAELSAAALALTAAAYLLRNLTLAARFWTLASLAFCSIALPAFWFGKFLIPQPERYHLQMEMALCGLAGVALSAVLNRGRLFRWGIYSALAILSVQGALQFRRYVRQDIRGIDIATTVEYRIARWLEQNTPGQRTFVHGSAYFWLDAFSQQPQLAGGFAQGVTNPLQPAVSFQVTSGMNAGPREGEIAVALLKAFGVDTVAVGGPQSREYYKDYQNPGKFEGLLPEIWREGDDAIYRVPRRSPSLAHVMRRQDLVAAPPVYVTQIELLAPYLAALDNPAYPPAQIEWTRPGAFSISANLGRGEILSVQETYDPGWQAAVSGKPVPLRPDGLHQMVIEPACEGPCSVMLEYTGGAEMRTAKLAQWITALGGVLWLLLRGAGSRPAKRGRRPRP